MPNDNSRNDKKQKRGFAAMDENKQREIASLGGKAAHQAGTAHEFTPEEARNAGRLGGQARSRNSRRS
ncbi:MAG TPA: KGG domain-containing protein [Candidatus Paceibacterota bacterium]|nr:KGG domain-containing protein [Candidatus Paceibacterota bacterium]